MADKLVRFVSLISIEGRRARLGIIRAAYELEKAHVLSEEAENRLKRIYQWFNDNLDVPSRFARSNNTHAEEKALSWFKPTAQEHIGKARELSALLDAHQMMCEMLTTAKPGYVMYEDEHQVVAIPFRGDSG